jgi:hypothetical protein
MTATPTGDGYWLVASDGGIFAFGDGAFHGSTGAIKLNRPITGMAATPSGTGYWLAASDGGIFSFGDAGFYGAAPSRPAQGPRTVVAMVPSATGAGYWQVSSSGELLAFGDAADLGGASGLSRPIVGMAARPGPGSAGSAPGKGPDPTKPTVPTPLPTPPGGGPQTFSSTADVTWGTEPDAANPGYAGNVDAIVETAGQVVVAGEYTNVVDPPGTAAAPPQPYLTVLDTTTGAPVAGSTFNATANPDGAVYALAVSPDGRRLYVAGTFNHIGGHAAHKLAALDLATGAWDPTFSPAEPNTYVRGLALANGRLYIGGAFSTVGGTARSLVAAVDAQTGALLDSFTPPQDYGGVFSGHGGTPVEDPPGTTTPTYGNVRDLEVTGDGSTLLVGGDFLHFGPTRAADPSHKHGGLIALDAITGALTPWQPVNSRPVFSLTTWPGDNGHTVFAAAGGAGGVVESFVPGGANTNPLWTGHVDGDATGVVATTQRVYLVGHYDHEVPNPNDPCLQFQPQPNGTTGISCPNGTPHRHLAAFYPNNGNVDPSFTAQADTNKGPNTAALGAHHLYVGGDFNRVSDTPGANYRSQPGFAMYPAH